MTSIQYFYREFSFKGLHVQIHRKAINQKLNIVFKWKSELWNNLIISFLLLILVNIKNFYTKKTCNRYCCIIITTARNPTKIQIRQFFCVLSRIGSISSTVGNWLIHVALRKWPNVKIEHLIYPNEMAEK